MSLDTIINQDLYSIDDSTFQQDCRSKLQQDGALVLPNFLTPQCVQQVVEEGNCQKHLAYYTADSHNVYLRDEDPEFTKEHPRNRLVESSKGCITDDFIPSNSPLRSLYDAPTFRKFLAEVLEEQQLYNYADPLSSINLHYASEGQELGWHFDNSSFAITLLLQKPEQGGSFQYIPNMRNADQADMNYTGVEAVLNDQVAVQQLEIDPGALVLFRGRDAIHRVTPTVGDTTRMLVVLAYNSAPGIELSESARMTFYGRLN